MFEPVPEIEDSFDMHFYILVDDVNQWPEIEYATVLNCQQIELEQLIQKETNCMDVLLVCADKRSGSSETMKQLTDKFRITFNFDIDTNYLAEHQKSISELCWASFHSHNFDILDADSLLNRNTKLIAVNEQLISQGWKTATKVDSAILFLHHFTQESEQAIYHYQDQACKALGIDSIAAISFGDSRNQSACRYSLLAKLHT